MLRRVSCSGGTRAAAAKRLGGGTRAAAKRLATAAFADTQCAGGTAAHDEVLRRHQEARLWRRSSGNLI